VWATRPAGKHHQLRVIDESGKDYLYPEEYLVPVQLSQAAEKAVLRAANLGDPAGRRRPCASLALHPSVIT